MGLLVHRFIQGGFGGAESVDSESVDADCEEVDDGGVEIFTGDDEVSGDETFLEKDAILRKYVPGSIDWSHLAD